MKNMRETMRRLMIALNNIDETYCSDMSEIKVNESELWLMYALDDNEQHSQKQICEEWGFPKTTLNTAIKQAKAAGYLILNPIPGKRREMNICLTEKGKEYAKKVLCPVYQAEEQALRKTINRYSIEFVDTLEYFSVCLKSAFHNKTETNETQQNGKDE